jgi:hypothetical protein
MDRVSTVANGTGLDDIVDQAHAGEQFALF